ncbi:hypothetical protein PTMSG1_10525 [Pyrenophora teres f. maculata]|nr:hypothetical protein PTMSG1_10525 [Pyrenophora teres f. maculata]
MSASPTPFSQPQSSRSSSRVSIKDIFGLPKPPHKRFPYVPPTQAYCDLLTTASATLPPETVVSSLSTFAGWLASEKSDCLPVLIAHSAAAAVRLLRKSIGTTAIADDVWHQLLQEAVHLENPTPPSTQVPPLSTQKRPAPSTQDSPDASPEASGSSPKRARTEVDSDNNGAGQEDQVPPPAPLPARLTTRVSNNNRRAERIRDKRRELSRAKALQDTGLRAPSSKADAAEQIAHRSLSLQDAPDTSWILGQAMAGGGDFYTTARHPYRTAATMLQSARQLGNDKAKTHAAQFLRNWQQTGHPLGVNLTRASAVAGPASQASQASSSFRLTWDAVTQSETVAATAGIVYRWGMAWIGLTYQRTVEELQGSNAGGQGNLRSRAKQQLWEEQLPTATFNAFNARLKRARRWYEAAETLGWGSLLFLEGDVVTANWVEQTLRVSEWSLWLRLVQRVNPSVQQLIHNVDTFLGPNGLRGGPISNMQPVGAEVSEALRICEVPDSQDGSGDEEGDDEDEDDKDDHQSDGEDQEGEGDEARVALRIRGIADSQDDGGAIKDAGEPKDNSDEGEGEGEGDNEGIEEDWEDTDEL